ncbi:MAG: Holliday junction branch migration protein RuvA [bacterium]|nr:Holliday junction branch migration protein RuvA [bacterium]
MIDYISGSLQHKLADKITVETQAGVGYIINVSNLTLNNLPEQGASVKIFISESMNMYSGSSTWYGFLTSEERNLFTVIKGIQKIGAKGSIDILSKIDGRIEKFTNCIINKDIDILKTFFGFTKKKSEKLILGLKDKIDLLGLDLKQPEKSTISPKLQFHQNDAIEALKSLGYSPAIAKKTINQILQDCTNIEELLIEDVIKKALKNA